MFATELNCKAADLCRYFCIQNANLLAELGVELAD